MVAAVTALFFCGVDLWVWRVAVVDPCIGECRNFRAQFERQVEMHHAEISDLDRRTARIEGLLQLGSIRKRP